MDVDYIVVGFGLAGMAMCKELEDHGHSFIVMDNDSQKSSRVAAGVFNPVILKRFTPVWNAKSQLDTLFPFYKDLKKRLGGNYLHYFDTYKVFKSIEDQNNWFSACDKPLLEPYLEPNIYKPEINGIKYFEGFGKVSGTGRVLVTKVLDDYKEYLIQKKQYRTEAFHYEDLKNEGDQIEYKKITAKRIVFAEGYGIKNNPFFNELPLVGSKGEMLFIKAPELNLTEQIKSSLFVLPVGDDVYWVGATFNRTNKSLDITEEGRQELVEKLNSIIEVPYKILSQFGGIRPTVKDRKPLVGKHPDYQNIFILNGLGTRGVMIGPTVAKQLYNYMENKEELPKEININRFLNKN